MQRRKAEELTSLSVSVSRWTDTVTIAGEGRRGCERCGVRPAADRPRFGVVAVQRDEARLVHRRDGGLGAAPAQQAVHRLHARAVDVVDVQLRGDLRLHVGAAASAHTLIAI